ncbi:MAG: YfhO family protein [Leptolinea sp.]|jgi:hypothetical protein|nr:YfhO family protein [Leptolinea sp.]
MNEEIEKSKVARYLVILLPLLYLFFYLLQGKFILAGNTDHIDAQLTAIFAAKKALAVGQFPSWNPYIFNGIPLWGSPSVFIWYPFTWIELLAPQSVTLYVSTIISWLHYFAVFITGFVYFREIIKDERWASFSALVYGFSIPVAYGLSVGNAHLPIYVYLPLLLYVFHTFERRSFNRNVIFISILFYFMITGGFLQLFMYAMLIVGLYLIFLIIGLPSKKQRLLLLNISFISITIGVLLCAPLWISTFYMSRFVSRVSGSLSAWQNMLTENYLSELYQWLRLLLPNGFGFVMWNSERSVSAVETVVAFCGVSSLFLAGLAIIKCKESIVDFWNIIFILLLLLAYSPMKILQYLMFGGMDMMYGRVLFLLPFSVACLAGMGGKSLLEKDNISRLRVVLLNPICLLLTIIIITNTVQYNSKLFNFNSLFEKLFNLKSWYQFTELIPQIELFRLLVIFIVLIAVIFIRRNLNFIYSISLFLLVAEVIPSTYLMNMVQINPLMVSPSQDYFAYDNISQPLPYSSSFLEKYRLVISEEIPSRKPFTAPNFAKDANQGSVYDYYSPWGYANGYSTHLARLIKTVGFIDAIDCPSGGKIMGEYDFQFNSIRQVVFDPLCHPRLADLMSVGSVIKTDKEWKVIQDNTDTALERASLFYKYSVISDSIESSTKLAEENFDFYNVIILDRFPFGDVGPADPDARVSFTKNTPNEIILDVKTKSPGILLLNDSYYPGWSATVDKKPVEIIRANVAFRAVWIPEGEHRVVFSYSPPLLGISLLIGLLGVAALIILVNWTRIYIFVEGLRKKIKIDLHSLSEKKTFHIVCLTIPLLFYLIPLFSGYSWNSIGPNSPGERRQYNSLYPLEGYFGRVPDQLITV